MTFIRIRFLPLVCLSVLAVAPAYSQLFSFGIKGGVPLGDAYSAVTLGDGARSSHFNNRYTIGPTAEIHFPFHLSFEADVLYRHSRYSSTGSILPGGSATVNDWQVPLLAKLDVSHGIATPFVDGGVSYRHLAPTLNNPAGQLFLGVTDSNSAGVTVGGGLQFKLPLIRISPEIRYTRWAQTAFSNAAVTSNNNQIDLLLGVTF